MITSRIRAVFVAMVLFPAAALSEQETVKIALNVPFSGAFANIGDLYLNHAQLAIDAINARGGVLGGRKLEIVPFDNKNSPQEALLALKRITDQRIPFVVQGGGSHIAVPLSEAGWTGSSASMGAAVRRRLEWSRLGLRELDKSF